MSRAQAWNAFKPLLPYVAVIGVVFAAGRWVQRTDRALAETNAAADTARHRADAALRILPLVDSVARDVRALLVLQCSNTPRDALICDRARMR